MNVNTRKLTTVVFALGFAAFCARQSFADAVFRAREVGRGAALTISGTISKADADYVAQHETELNEVTVNLDSAGGDVAAAMKIGRIIRDSEATTVTYGKCFSSCALIYIAGVRRMNDLFTRWVIGLHRPYFSSAPLSRQEIEREVPLMLQKVKEYVQLMGVTDLLYEQMVNTAPSDMRLYRGNEINQLVPEIDPTYDEIQISYLARKYGTTTAEIRQRQQDQKQKCFIPDDPRAYGSSIERCWMACAILALSGRFDG
jgi:hypothetical protein